MRIFFQIVIGLVALVIGIAAIGVTTAWWAVGTPSHAASTVAATVTSTEGALGVGDMLLSTVLDSASPDERAVIEQRRRHSRGSRWPSRRSSPRRSRQSPTA